VIHARFGTYCLFEHLIDARLRERNVGLVARAEARPICEEHDKTRPRQCGHPSPIPPPSTDQTEAIMAKEPKTLDNLFHNTLRDIYFAEKKILSTLPKMAKSCTVC